MSESYILKEHREWIGLLQPVGLVVAPSALERAQLRLQKDVFSIQEEFRSITSDTGLLPLHFSSLFTRVLGWRSEDLVSGEEIKCLDAYLPERETLLKADYAVKNIDSSEFDILIKYIDQLQFDEEEFLEGRGWQATPHVKFERHLREKNLDIGILANQFGLRLIYAKKGETSGYLTFPFGFMRETQGRPVLAALHLLLGEDRIFKGDPKQRLHNLLHESRKFQNDVSTQLSTQVLAALYELIRGLQEANDESKGKLLNEVLNQNKNDVYHANLIVLLRVVFILFAEDRDLLSSDSVFLNNYSINGLFTKLREDYSKHHDSMNLRYGAWAHLLSLFRLVYEGIELGADSIPGRKGHLFDPDRFPFLEGRLNSDDEFEPPRISDGVVWRVLSNLMTLDGERISYRALDVEQIGSVYETVMGFQLEIASGPSIAIKSVKTHGAPVVIDLNDILNEKSDKRTAKLKELSDNKFEGKIAEAIKVAKTPDDLVAAIGKRVADWATPIIVESGSMILQPSDERRRSGSHYTPRTLTAPIVAKALEPILKDLGEAPTPEMILSLKICDPAMGSGAFLVETCRQLSELLVKSWALHKPDIRKEIPLDEDELLYARRLIAQRCLYGVDKNPMAVNLGKLSLWLATFAKQHDFTFLDHCLKCGDSLVGVSLQEIKEIAINSESQLGLVNISIEERIKKIKDIREQIMDGERANKPNVELQKLNSESQNLINDMRSIGDLLVGVFFFSKSKKDLSKKLHDLRLAIENILAAGLNLIDSKPLYSEILNIKNNINPFQWQLEFIEIFDKPDPGFDCILGNPPFLGGSKISSLLSKKYKEWLYSKYTPCGDRMDLVAYFFRKSHDLVNYKGTISFIATNTIHQGDTRNFGLMFLVNNKNAFIYAASKRIRWPGLATVIVSVVHLSKKIYEIDIILNKMKVTTITPFLLGSGPTTNPNRLESNYKIASKGVEPLGNGFVFSNSKKKDNPLKDLELLINAEKMTEKFISQYIGGEDINKVVDEAYPRKIVNVSSLSEDELLKIRKLHDYLSLKVKKEREKARDEVKNFPWWKFWRPREQFVTKQNHMKRILAISRVSAVYGLTFVKSDCLISDSVVGFLLGDWASFGILQSRVHEVWARFLSSTLGDGLRYVSTDCFETFPFPTEYTKNTELLKYSEEYFIFRKSLMIKNKEGLTKLYNKFHDPSNNSEEILKLRAMHENLDLLVLKSYGWDDLKIQLNFINDYEGETGDVSISYKWEDSVGDEVISRLMNLNKMRKIYKVDDSYDYSEDKDDDEDEE